MHYMTIKIGGISRYFMNAKMAILKKGESIISDIILPKEKFIIAGDFSVRLIVYLTRS